MNLLERIWFALSAAAAIVGAVVGLAGDLHRMAFLFIVAIGLAMMADGAAEDAGC